MPDSPEATSAAVTADASSSGSGNLTQGQAAARLFAKSAETSQPTPPVPATDETAPEKSEEPAAPVAEVVAASVEPESEDTPTNAAVTSAPGDDEDLADPDVPSQPTSVFTPEQQKIFDKRLGKEIGKRTALEARLAEMEARQGELTAKVNEPAATTQPLPALAPSRAQPLPEFQDQASLDAHKEQAKAAIRWAEDALENPRAWKTKIDTDPNTGEEKEIRYLPNGEKSYTEDDVRAIRRTAKVVFEDKAPAQEKFLTARQQAQKFAHQEFPFLTDKKSPEYQQAQAILRDPWMADRPDAEYIAAVYVRGMNAIQAEKAAAKAAADKPKAKLPAAKPSSDQSAVSATAAATRVPVSTQARQALSSHEAKMRQKGGITTAEATASLMTRERMRNSR